MANFKNALSIIACLLSFGFPLNAVKNSEKFIIPSLSFSKNCKIM